MVGLYCTEIVLNGLKNNHFRVKMITEYIKNGLEFRGHFFIAIFKSIIQLNDGQF